MRAHRRMGASIAGVIGALMIASSALGASPWLSLRQQGVTAVSVHLACVDGRAGTLRCEAEILQAFTGRLKITGSRTEHAQLVCYQKLEATVDPETGETIDAHGVFGCS